VQYGLGWLPFGGFVALPQMAPMDAIEGGGASGEPLPAATPLDKIIVAFAGPLFSLLLALACAGIVWLTGKPADIIPTQEIGYVLPDSPAERAGLKPGDRITHVNGVKVHGFAGPLDSIFSSIVLTKESRIEFVVERPGQSAPLTLVSEFQIPESRWWQRRGLPQVGISPMAEAVILAEIQAKSPAAKAGLKAGDRLVAIDGKPFLSSAAVIDYIAKANSQPMEFTVDRAGEQITRTLSAVKPKTAPDDKPRVGVAFMEHLKEDLSIIHPGPLSQVKDSLLMMWTTISGLLSPKSKIGVDHLSGPVGIAKHKFALLKGEFPWQRLLAFMVLFNVNLAVLNLLPFPVLDGGHITLSVLEAIARRPVQARVLETIQTAFALLLVGLMLYVTSKDLFDPFGRGQRAKIEFAD
nr:RIP metalloprotease RseP [Akkermansiaceae bacterium]